MRIPAVLLLLLALPAYPQALTRANLHEILGFEDSQNGRISSRWLNSQNPEVAADSEVFHSGGHSVRITRTATADFTTITAVLPQDFSATNIELRGFVKLENVNDYIALWLRQDGAAGSQAFATLQGQNIKGTADWKEYSVNIRLQPNGRQIAFGFFLFGPGRAWADSLQLLADGKPIAEAPAAPVSVLFTDTEFDAGSKVNVTDLTDLQVSNLAALAKVWGFLKYHHTAVTEGTRHWDYELFRVMPAVLAASDAAAANKAIHEWAVRLGAPKACSACATIPVNLRLSPDNDWIWDADALGKDLSETLQMVYSQRSTAGTQFFAGKAPNVGNPAFENELAYPALRHPDSGLQLLAMFRFWNMMQYFNPNRDIMGDDPSQASAYWHGVLSESMRPFALAQSRLEYQRALLRFIAKINDTHANLWSGTSALPPMGPCYLPVDMRFVEGKAVVYRRTGRESAGANPLQVGDVITQLDGSPVEDLLKEWTPHYPASNEPTRLRDIARYMTRGACSAVPLTVERDGAPMQLSPSRVATSVIDFSRSSVHDLPGTTFQKLADDVAYLKLSSFRIADAVSYVRQSEGTKGMIIDIRNYPSEFAVFALGQLLVPERTTFVQFTEVDMSNPGGFYQRAAATLVPQSPQYRGKIVILIDEVTQSQAEYTTMAFRTAPGAVVLGSTTAGADGNVSTIVLPGAQSSYISGIGVFYPDGRPTQRVGIVPDVEVLPTVKGIREGRDELVEEAIRIIRAQ